MSDPREPPSTERPDAEPPDLESGARDERLAALLEVPLLDEVTRRRLVREALDRPVPRASRLTAAMAIAAAVVVGIAVGTVLVQDDNPVATTTAQGGQPSATSDTQALEKAASPGAFATSVAPITPLGGLGDITKPADLREAIDGGFARSAGPTDDSAVPLAYPCASTPAETLDLVATTALGLGFYRGFPVTIFVGTSPDGEARAVVVRQDDCTELASVNLRPA